MFLASLTRATHYLEFGAGSSTREAVRIPGLQHIFAVESDPAFLQRELRTDPEIRSAEEQGRLTFFAIDIGPIDAWGNPRDRSQADRWPDYALKPFVETPVSPDMILVDGRFRIACCLAAGLRAPHAKLWVHDFNTRPNYGVLKDFFAVRESVDSLVRLERLPHFDEARAQVWLDRYVQAPFDEPQGVWHHVRCVLAKVRGRLLPR